MPQALVNKWRKHEHPVTQRIASSLPAAVEGEIEPPRVHHCALQMDADEKSALEPLLRRAEDAINRNLEHMLRRAAQPPLAAAVMNTVAAALSATPIHRDDIVCLSASHGGGLAVVETYALVRRLEWGVPRYVLHVYVAQECENEGSRIARSPGRALVSLYATGCGCQSPSQQA